MNEKCLQLKTLVLFQGKSFFIFKTGTEKIKAVAKQTLEEVREAMAIKYF